MNTNIDQHTAEVVVHEIQSNISKEAFLHTVNAWTTNPEKIVKFLSRAEILSENENEDGSVKTVLRRLIPRLADKDPVLEECVVLDMQNVKVSYFPVLPNNAARKDVPIYYPKVWSYSLNYVLNHNNAVRNNPGDGKDAEMIVYPRATLQLRADEIPADPSGEQVSETTPSSPSASSSSASAASPHFKQVAERLLKKLNSWGTNHMKPGGYKPIAAHGKVVTGEQFEKVYGELKTKHKHWVEHWPAQTDSVKFVYEDIAIAAYLICLWRLKEEDTVAGQFKYKFVDVGCGNGFLVYILQKEGFHGYGVDLHKRNIWNEFECSVDLRVQVIDPSSVIFPEVEWILGNHSDELTPWIPIITRRSSPLAKFWVLPCCFHQFGRKFDTAVPKGGRYRAYLNYIKGIAETCGFEAEEDAIRIPSTKNTCFVGTTRVSTDESIEEKFEELLRKEGFNGFIAREAPSAGKKARH
eukprot:TRINITY_DN19058_c0_g2_i2.p1 TRINITY_DN19058_c0_g2~~TRINITY_DN19058_c0_g2_i2.p1  ORF type:complete len:467 (+),score=123.99 TRINITY_DN19058_c0_g2_i2:214-1614(+)